MWHLNDTGFNEQNRPAREATYTLGNGYFGVRGFFEEEPEGILSLGGIYMGGIFGDGNFEAWNGKNRELVNVPNFLAVRITCDGDPVTPRGVTGYFRQLDIRHGVLTRGYVWQDKLKVTYERFVSAADIHVVCQRITFSPLREGLRVEIDDTIDTNNSNLNKVSCEPLPIQPGDRHYTVLEKTADTVQVRTDGITPETICIRQQTEFQDWVFTRRVAVYTTRDVADPAQAASATLPYEEYKERHCREWERRWATADITLESCPEDQLALRYDLFQLMCVAPNDDSRIGIGARGLTGEMYEGCVFWDTEIFKMPFFIYENPRVAKSLLRFRYNMLPAAKQHAKDLWFDGAMYPWQSCNLGYEQTPVNGGAFYAIHIVSDIAYALMQYYRVTGDVDFMIECGTEMLIETARFWASRATVDTAGRYHILAVRGPNEYDVIVNNNCYTNMMAQENVAAAVTMIRKLEQEYPSAWQEIAARTAFDAAEITAWEKLAENIVLCYDPERKLYEEDDTYTRRVPLDLKKAKPTGKRIIDSTMPYEALPLYQVTKQADVICLMNNLPWRFTEEEKRVAWEYYEPKTAHDSSLSYCSYSIMASKLGMAEMAYEYFRTCAYLDIEDIKLNSISGLHFANFGGTWQTVIYGFGGLSVQDNTLRIQPHFPEKWGKVTFHVWFRGNLVRVEAQGNTARTVVETSGGEPIEICVDN